MPKIIYDSNPRKHVTYTVRQSGELHIPQIEGNERIIIFIALLSQLEGIKSRLKDQPNVDESLIFTYHGKMTAIEKDKNQNDWLTTQKSIMVASTAFSLGIDYPHVRLLYVIGSTYGLDSLIQMFGRAGRDNQKSECIYHFSYLQSHSIDNKERGLLADLEGNAQCVR